MQLQKYPSNIGPCPTLHFKNRGYRHACDFQNIEKRKLLEPCAGYIVNALIGPSQTISSTKILLPRPCMHKQPQCGAIDIVFAQLSNSFRLHVSRVCSQIRLNLRPAREKFLALGRGLYYFQDSSFLLSLALGTEALVPCICQIFNAHRGRQLQKLYPNGCIFGKVQKEG